MTRFIKVFYIVILLLINFYGCATKEAIKKVSDEEVLRERVNGYWTSKIEGDVVKSYEYELPLTRMGITKYITKYANPMLKFKSFAVQEIEKKDDDVADVKLAVVPVVKVPGSRAFEYKTVITERWVRVNDFWYHTFKQDSSNLIHKKEEGGDVTN